MRGGKREGAGPPTGKRTDNVKMGISISRRNAEWLKSEKKQGKSISRIIDIALNSWQYRSSWKSDDESYISMTDDALEAMHTKIINELEERGLI